MAGRDSFSGVSNDRPVALTAPQSEGAPGRDVERGVIRAPQLAESRREAVRSSVLVVTRLLKSLASSGAPARGAQSRREGSAVIRARSTSCPS